MKYFIKSRLSENITETPEGFLLCLGVPIARTGEMEYMDGETPLKTKNGKVVIERDAKEVFRPQTIASFEGKPITIGHPQEFVDPANWNNLSKGHIQNVRKDGDSDLIADLLIQDARAIQLVKNGLREVSCGYEAEYEQEEEGRGRQLNIIGNHLALVEEGRAGSAYAIKDAKGVDMGKKGIAEKLKAIFAKVADEAAEEMGDAEEKKEAAKDAEKPTYDDLVKMCDDLKAKIGQMEGKKDDAKDADKEEGEEKKDESKDAEVTLESLAKRLEALEAKLSAKDEKADGEEMKDEDAETSDEDKEEAKDDDVEESGMVGDSAELLSRSEILAPGKKFTKNVKAEALKYAYATADGKKAIDKLTAGKAPAFDSKDAVETLFVAASELLKTSRQSEVARLRRTNDYQPSIARDGIMTAEQINEANAKFYGSK